MAPEFQVKTTGELTPGEIAGLTRLFEAVFHKPCPEEMFRRKYACSCLGYSTHSLMFREGELIGAFSAIPVRFEYFGRVLLFAITADLMVDPRHRGPIPRIQQLAEGLYESLARTGVAFVFCCLRDEVCQFHVRVSEWRAIGKVYYYAAPFRLPRLAALSAPVRGLVRLWNRLSSGWSEPGDVPFAIAKVNDVPFTSWRYGIFPNNYTTVELPGGGKAIYSAELCCPIAGIPPQLRLGLLIDVFPLTKANFDEAVVRIRRQQPGLTVLAYQGRLPFQPRDMLRIPARYEKQRWTLAGRILRPDQVDDRVFDPRHWNINLSNGDLV